MDEDEAIRAHFPLSFGKKTKSKANVEALHAATRRATTLPTPSPPSPTATTTTSHSRQGDFFSHPAGSNLRRENGRSRSDVEEKEENLAASPMIGPPRPDGFVKGEEDEDDGVMVGPPRPPAAAYFHDDDDGAMVGPPRPQPTTSGSQDSDSDSDDYSYDGVENSHRIPMTNEIVLKGHSKVVAALAIDHSGSRVLSGSYDYTVRMYDFQGMNSKLQSFRQIEPFEGHQVRSLSWSPTADRFLCVSGSAQAKIYDRDGLTLGEFIKGDMYIRDLKNTKGHISGLTAGEWNPRHKDTILTSSEDGSLRIWDVSDFKSQKQVIKPKLARPGRVPVTTCAWNHDGKQIVGGVGDGSIQVNMLDLILYKLSIR